MSKYYLQMREGDALIPKGDPRGYTTYEEAVVVAKKSLDDALPANTVEVTTRLGTAYLAGDGSEAFAEEDKADPDSGEAVNLAAVGDLFGRNECGLFAHGRTLSTLNLVRFPKVTCSAEMAIVILAKLTRVALRKCHEMTPQARKLKLSLWEVADLLEEAEKR